MADEVGSLKVDIFPVMTGFRSKVMGEARSAGQQGGSLFSNLFSKAGGEAGRKAGRQLKTAFRGAASSMQVPGLTKLNDQISKLSRTVTSEHNRMLNASDKARIAQTKLNETVEKYGSSSKRVQAAQTQLADAVKKYGANSEQARTAQNNLNETVRKYGANSSQVQSALARLDSAQRTASQYTSRYKDDLANLKPLQQQRNELEKAYAPPKYDQAVNQIKRVGVVVQNTLKASKDAQAQVKSAYASLQTAVTQYGAKSEQAANAQKKLSEAQQQADHSAKAYQAAVKQLTKAEQDASKIPAPKTSAWREAINSLKNRVGTLRSSFSSAAKSGESMGSRIKTSTVALGAALGNAITSGVSAIKNFGQECISVYNSASTGIVQFNTVAANNHWSDAQKAGLDRLSQSLQHEGVISAATNRAAMTQLGTMHLSTNAIKQLTPALDDMMAKQHGLNTSAGDASQTALKLARAIGGSTTALSRYGITMSDAEKKSFAKMSTDQRAARIAQLLEEHYHGVNKALAETPAGKVKQLQNNFNGLKATLGKSFTQTIGAVAPSITAMLTKAQGPVTRFAKWVSTAIGGISKSVKTGNINGELKKAFGVNATPILQGLQDIRAGFKAAFSAITGQAGSAGRAIGGMKNHVSPLASAFRLLGGVVRIAGNALKALGPAVGPIAGIILSLVAAFKVYQTTVTAVTVVNRIFNLTLAANPIGAVVTAIAAVVAALIALEAKFHIFEKAGGWIKKTWNGVSKWFQGIFNGIGKWAQNTGKNIQKHFSQAKSNVQKAWNNTGKWFNKIGNDIGKTFQKAGKNIQKHFADANKNSEDKWKNAGKWAKQTGRKVSDGFKDLKSKIGKHFADANKASEAKWKGVAKWAQNKARDIGNGFNSLRGKISKHFGDAQKASTKIWQNTPSWFKNSIAGHIVGAFVDLPGKLSKFFSDPIGSIKRAWNGIVDWFKGIPGRIQGIFSGAGQWLSQAGQSIIHGFMSGITNAWNNVKGFFGRIGDWIKAHKGPLDYDRQLLVPAGHAIMGGFHEGLETEFSGSVEPMVSGVAQRVSDLMNDNLKIASRYSSTVPEQPSLSQAILGQNGSVSSSVVQKVNVYTTHDDLYNVAPILYRSTRNEVIGNVVR